MTKIHTQVCIIGAGAGGTGCAYRLIRNGIKTVVIDKNPDFGGAAVFSGVDGWEPGITLDGVHTLFRDELEKMENGCHIIGGAPNSSILINESDNECKDYPYSEFPICYLAACERTYDKTLTTWKNGAARFQFEPVCMVKAIHNVMAPYSDNLTSFFEYSYKSCTKEKGKITSITITNGNIDIEILADYFVDATENISVARDAGCDHTFGAESPDELGEPSASDDKTQVNGVSYIFRIAKSDDPNHIDALPDDIKDIDISDWASTQMKRVVGYSSQYPNGDINVNMLPTMDGNEYFSYSEKADKIGIARVYAFWHYLQTEKNMRGWYLKKIYNAGVRESYRLKGKYILKEQDLRKGWLRQPKIGRTIAIADHAIDIHGKKGLGVHLDSPYEVPIECTMTKEFDNLYVSSMGASFSHLAASSVRLTRTVLSIGEGVGEYISELLMNKA